jgi:Zn-dependent peptidase ImmA (M78 family)
MRRGFKSEAERVALDVRHQLGKRSTDALEPSEMASHVGAKIRRADELTSIAKLELLEELQPGAFSACTFTIGSRHVIVYNPISPTERTRSDIAHETAHILLKHAVKEVHQIGTVSFFSCDPDEEQEANWLAGCLLLPRPLLLAAAKRGWGIKEISKKYTVSEQMATFRLRTTGVSRQIDLMSATRVNS